MSRTQLENLTRMLRAGGERDPGAPLERVRTSFERLGRLLGPPDGLERGSLRVAGVECEWTSGAAAREGGGGTAEIVYLHGGGYVSGSPATHRGLVGRLALAAGAPVLSVAYRLAPENPYPAALEDCVAVTAARLESVAEGRGVVLAGDSAGGGLVLSVLAALRDRGAALPAAGVCLSPWTDLEATGGSVHEHAEADPLVSLAGLRRMADLYLAGASPREPGASPLHARLEGLPPMLILVGGAEVLRDDAVRIARALEGAGVDVTLEVWEGMLHVWPLYSRLLDEGQEAIDRIAAFARSASGGFAG